MRKVYLDNLPKHENGGINWKKSVGKTVSFVYDEYFGKLKILERKTDNKTRLLVEYKNKKEWINSETLRHGQIGKIVGYKRKYDLVWKYQIGEIIKDDKRDITILDKFLIMKFDDSKNKTIQKKYYKYRCNICGYVHDSGISEYEINSGVNCSVCEKHRTAKGINDIATLEPWMSVFLVDKNDAYRLSPNSGKKVLMRCPICNRTKFVSPNKLYARRNISCICNDGFSYPEKFMFKVLEQSGIDFIWQFSKSIKKWCKNYKYDFYIPSIDCIIETHGIQHYERSFQRISKNCRSRTLEEEQKNDIAKYNNAINKVKYYVVIDCRLSNKEYIWNNIVNSELYDLISMKDVNLNECEKFARENLIKEVCTYKNENPEITSTELGNIFKISKNTVIRYLKIGNENNWCTYNSKEEMRKSAKKNQDKMNIVNKNIKQSVCEHKLLHKEITVKELSAIYNRSLPTIYNYLKSEGIPY